MNQEMGDIIVRRGNTEARVYVVFGVTRPIGLK